MPRDVKRECPVCLVTYYADPGRLKFGRQTTCSRTCSYRARAEAQDRQVDLVCATCEAQFTRSPAHIKSKHGAVFCSATCQYVGRSRGLTPRVVTKPYVRVAGPPTAEQIARRVASRRAGKGYGHSDEFRARRSEAMARAIAEGRIAAVSKLEGVVAEVLDTLGVGYKRQSQIRGPRGTFVASLDFLLSDGRALEVNGTFWHADPVVYPDGPVYPAQRRSAERWDRKVTALAAAGIPLLVVWERELRDDSAKAVKIALATV